jgi:hypothetical protein
MAKERDKISELGQSLLQATAEGKVEWTVAGEENFRARVGEGFVRVSREYEPPVDDSEGGMFYRVTVLDRRGNVVDEQDYREGSPAQRLHALARRSALDADRLIDGMLDALSQKAG